LDEDIGHTLVHYLYTGTYQTLKLRGGSDDAGRITEYRISVLAYCAARMYGLNGLNRFAKDNIERLGKGIPIFDFLDVTREAYPKLPEDETWFSDHLKKRIKSAFEANGNLFKQSGLVDRIGKVSAFDKALLKIIVEVYNERIAGLISEKHNPCEVDPSPSCETDPPPPCEVDPSLSCEADPPPPCEEAITYEAEPPPCCEEPAPYDDDPSALGEDAVPYDDEPLPPCEEPALAPARAEPEPAADLWGSWGTIGKKKCKKAVEEDSPSLPPPPAPTAPQEPAPAEEWIISSREKKKKKNAFANVFANMDDVPASAPLPSAPAPAPAAHEPEPATDNIWNITTTAKGKRGGKKKCGIWDVEEDPAPIVAADAEVSSPPADNDLSGSCFSTGPSKKDKKNRRKGLVEEVQEDPLPPVVKLSETQDKDATLGGDDDWLSGWGTAFKRDKKKEKMALLAEVGELTPAPESCPTVLKDPAPTITDDVGWGPTTTNKKNKKAANNPVSGKTEAIPRPPPVAPEPAMTNDWDLWCTTTSTYDKDKKRKGLEDIPIDPAPEVPPAEEETWGSSWGAVKTKKKSKKGKQAEEPPPAPNPPVQGLTPEPTPPRIPELDDQDVNGRGSLTKTLTKTESKTAKRSTKKGSLSRTPTTISNKTDYEYVFKDKPTLEPGVEESGICTDQAKHCDSEMWKKCSKCKVVFRQVALQLARAGSNHLDEIFF
jgi:hypothetical protein